MGYIRKGNKTMNVQDWKQKIGEMVRANMRTPEADRYYNLRSLFPGLRCCLNNWRFSYDIVVIAGRMLPATVLSWQ